MDFSELDISDYSFVYGIKTNSDVFYALPGTYYGSNGSGLILFNDYTAERYSASLGDEIVNDCYWYYKDDQFVLKLSNPSATVYANISVDNAESMLLQSKSSSWTTEEYIKISDETVSLSTGEYRDLIVNGQKQAEISKAIASIDNIGIVNKNSGDGIKHARSLYDALDSDGKEQVSNIEVLEAAEASYSAIMITEIENAIESIGEVTLDSESTISTARKLYDQVDAQTQKSISNYDILTQAEENLSQLKVEHVTESIAAINVDKLTLDDESTVKSVQAEFNKLTNDEKAQVENSQVISDANGRLAELKKEEQERLKAEKEKELNNALAKLQKEEDKVTGITYYKPSNYPKYLNNKSYALPYLGVKGDDVQVLISMDYYGDSWIFWHTVTFAVDDYRWSQKYYDVSRDVDNGGDVVEFKSITCGTEEIAMLSKIADSDETIIRFQGDDYKKDITFSASDKKAVGELMEAYRLLKAR